MPLDFRVFKKEIESYGYSVELTSSGHYWVMTATGGKLILFAVSHKKNSRGKVYDAYVSRVRKAIRRDQGI